MSESDSNSSTCISERDINIKQLINEVKQRPAIWQKKGAVNDYRVAQKNWTEIAEIFGVVHVDALKKKWRNLRDSFFRKHKAVIRSDNSGNSKQKWCYYSSLLFLDSWNANNNSKDYSSENQKIDYKGLNLMGSYESDSDDSNSSASVSPINKKSGTLTEDRIKPKKRKMSEILETFQNDLIDLERKKISRLTSDDQDDDLLFFRSLLPHIKTLDLQRKMVLRTRIQEIITDYIFHPPCNYTP